MGSVEKDHSVSPVLGCRAYMLPSHPGTNSPLQFMEKAGVGVRGATCVSPPESTPPPPSLLLPLPLLPLLPLLLLLLLLLLL